MRLFTKYAIIVSSYYMYHMGGGHDMNDKKIVVIFPGGNYSADCALLYYAGFKFEDRVVNFNINFICNSYVDIFIYCME